MSIQFTGINQFSDILPPNIIDWTNEQTNKITSGIGKGLANIIKPVTDNAADAWSKILSANPLLVPLGVGAVALILILVIMK
jgi:hypothetical protein